MVADEVVELLLVAQQLVPAEEPLDIRRIDRGSVGLRAECREVFGSLGQELVGAAHDTRRAGEADARRIDERQRGRTT